MEGSAAKICTYNFHYSDFGRETYLGHFWNRHFVSLDSSLAGLENRPRVCLVEHPARETIVNSDVLVIVLGGMALAESAWLNLHPLGMVAAQNYYMRCLINKTKRQIRCERRNEDKAATEIFQKTLYAAQKVRSLWWRESWRNRLPDMFRSVVDPKFKSLDSSDAPSRTVGILGLNGGPRARNAFDQFVKAAKGSGLTLLHNQQ